MAQKITWRSPEDDTVTTVYIYRSSTKYGSYSEVTNIDATDDGLAKSASNSWVTEYTDPTGERTHWYKIRFYDGSNYSDYSEPITAEQLFKLCSVDDVKAVIDTVGRWTDDDIFDAICEVEDMMYVELGTPIHSTISDIGYNSNTATTYRTYFVGEETIYRVDRLFLGTTTKRELFLDDEYKVNLPYGMVRFLPVVSSGPALDKDEEVEIRYVPKIYNRLATYKTAKFLLEKVDYANTGKVSNELKVITKRVDDIERLLNNRVGFMLSSDYETYDSVYGVNRKRVTQDFDKNTYIASYGW